jgi:phospholipid/cholesterol/gamma-HCH transport system permease protein
MTIDASSVKTCDGAGIGLILDLERRAKASGKEFEVSGLREEFSVLLEQFPADEFVEWELAEPESHHILEHIGEETVALWRSMVSLIEFTGELCRAFVWAAIHPHRVRWKDVVLYVEKTGVDAVPILGLLSLLIGIILAFQAGITMERFGAGTYVGVLVSISVVRELGPFMTALILAARTGSSYAAELGTMRINEELDAMNVMGLDPVRFLVVTRTLAAVIVTPLLALYADLLGLVGGGMVFRLFGFSTVTYWHHIKNSIDMSDVVGGLVKVFVFSILVAGVGCLRGLQTSTGARGVGDSTTRAVVSGIVLLIIADFFFGIVYWMLGV